MRSFIQFLEEADINASIWDCETDEVIVTPRFWSALGYSEPELPQSRSEWWKLVPADDIFAVRQAIDAHLRGDTPFYATRLRLKAADGSYQVAESHGRVVAHRNDGQPKLVLATFKYIEADPDLAQIALEDHERIVVAQEGAGAGTWEVDLRTHRVALDTQSLRLHGLPEDMPAPITQQQWAETVDGGAEEIIQLFQESVEKGRQYAVEYSTGNERFWIAAFGRTIRSPDGDPIKFVGLNLDITERKRSDRLLAKVRADLIELARGTTMENTASTLAHELNQPLGAALNYLAATKLLLPTAQASEALEKAEEAVRKAAEIVKRIKVGLGKSRSSRARTDLRDVVYAAGDLTLASTKHDHLNFSVRVPRGLYADIDAIQIEQVLINLFRNAIEALDGIPEPALTVTGSRHADVVQLRVANNGAAVSAAIRKSMFEAFATSKDEGTGLGLAISRTIVEAHGGKIWLDKAASPTTFIVELPASHLPPEGPIRRTNAAHRSSSKPAAGE